MCATARPYQDVTGDGSNRYHPSDRVMEDVWEETLRDLYLYVIRQARSPQCPVDLSGNLDTANCLGDDFGLVGAKIGNATDQAGGLSYDFSTREEELHAGTRAIVYAVQNFSGNAGTVSTNATVTIEQDNVVVDTHVEPITLAAGDRATFTHQHAFQTGSEYRVTIELDSDDFANNDTKVFAFNAWSAFTIAPADFLGTSKIKVKHPVDGTQTGRITLKTDHFLKNTIRPDLGGLDISILALPPWIPIPVPNPEPVEINIPSGAAWLDKSKPSKGRWRWQSADKLQKVLIKDKLDKKSGLQRAKLSYKSRSANVEDLKAARAYTIKILADTAGGSAVNPALLYSVVNVKRGGPDIPEKSGLPIDEPIDDGDEHD